MSRFASLLHILQLDSGTSQLKFEERRMYEEALQEATASGKPIKPIGREAPIGELQRLERESRSAVAGLTSLWPSSPPPEVDRVFLPSFLRYAGSEVWLDAANRPARARAEPRNKPPAARMKTARSRNKKSGARSDVASS